MKGQESLFSQVFVLAISMFAVWITFVYSAFFKFNKNLQKNSAELIYRKCSPRKFCRINLQLYVCNMFFSSCICFLQTKYRLKKLLHDYFCTWIRQAIYPRTSITIQNTFLATTSTYQSTYLYYQSAYFVRTGPYI